MSLDQIFDKKVGLWLQSGEIRCAEEINEGFCADFADDIMSEYKDAFSLEFCDSFDLYNEDVLFSALYSHVSENNATLKRLLVIAKADMNCKAEHTFLYSWDTKKFYDAEAPQGVTDPLDLPIFKRFCDEVEQMKKISA